MIFLVNEFPFIFLDKLQTFRNCLIQVNKTRKVLGKANGIKIYGKEKKYARKKLGKGFEEGKKLNRKCLHGTKKNYN
jgi:hypothetical protein